MMLTTILFSTILLWGKFIIPVILIVAPLWLGNKLGFWYHKKARDVSHEPLGSVVAAGLGLFAFILAFTFQITSSRFDNRKKLVIEEVSAIRTSYLNAGLLKDSNRIPVRQLLEEYIDLYVLALSMPDSLQMMGKRLRQIHNSLWLQAETLANEDRSSEIYELFISSVSDLIKLHEERAVVVLQYRIPPLILWILYFIAFFSMLVLGVQFGISGKTNSTINLMLALIFSAAIWLIFVLDNPEAGILNVSQHPYFELQEQIHNGIP